MAISSQADSQMRKPGHMHQSRNNFHPGDNKKYNTLNTEANEMDDEAYSKAVAILDAKLASKQVEKTGDKNIDDCPGPPLGDIPQNRNIINKKLKQKLKQKGFRYDERAEKDKKLLTDPEFYKDFMLKCKCLYEI